MLPVLQRRAGIATGATRMACWAILPVAVIGLAIGVRAAPPQERDAGGFGAPTAALERGRAVYVLNHCHFCHGVDLTKATMGAANLSQSPLVGADTDGDAIGPVVMAGLPNLQTAMPSYRDLTPNEIVDLARYIHYLRQQAKYRELTGAPGAPTGDAASGKQYFGRTCASCHSPSGNLAGVGRRHDAATLRVRLLRPDPAAPVEGVPVTAGHAAHLRLLENYTRQNVEDPVAYLGGLR